MGPAFDRFIEYVRSMTVRDEVERLDWAGPLVDAFNEATGADMDLPLTDQDRIDLRLWLQKIYIDPESAYAQVVVYRSILSAGFFLTTGEKASFLTQTACVRCPSDRGTPLSATYPIGIAPISAQSASTEQRALFRARIESAFSKNRDARANFGKRSLCVTVTSLLAIDERRKDADNLCKALLDELQGYIYANDSTIQHLQSYRFEYGGTFSGHLVRVAGVRTDVNADVLDPNKGPIFLSGMPDF